MKNVLLGICLIMALTSNASVSNSSFPIRPYSVSAFDFLQGHKQGTGFALQWKMGDNVGVSRYEVESTYEDPYDIYSNWTAEGSVNDPKKGSIKFLDNTIYPGVVSYRVRAVFINGRPAEVSDIYITTIE